MKISFHLDENETLIFIWKDEPQDSLWKRAKDNVQMDYWFKTFVSLIEH